MDINSQVATLVSYLEQTLHYDVNIRKPAEKFLESNERSPGFAKLLLIAISSRELGLQIRIAAAIAFKNFVRRNWMTSDGEQSNINEEDRCAVRQMIVGMLLDADIAIEKQLSEVVTLIGRHDFPDKWPELLPTLTAELQSDQMKRVVSCLRTAHALFKRYRHETKSNELWRELKQVLDQFAEPLTNLFKRIGTQTIAIARSGNSDVDRQQLDVSVRALVLMTKVFHSLNAQDLPEYFEDNMNIWMPGLLELLKLDTPLLVTGSDDEVGPLELLRSSICDVLTMYAQMYDEEFHGYLEQFIEVVWNVLVRMDEKTKYDLVVSNAINFLAKVCERDHYKAMFEREGALKSICDSVVVKNMFFRESDAELFTDNPDEYARRDIEGSDIDTRRRSAADFVRALCRFFETQLMEIFGAQIVQLLAEYSANMQREFAKKDAVFCLVSALAKRGETVLHGATKTSQLVPLVDFFDQHVLPELVDTPPNQTPVLKADALKYIVSFRSQLPTDRLVNAINAAVNLLRVESVVVRNYSAHAIERLLLLKRNNTAAICAEDLNAIAVMTNLFGSLELPGTEESEYVMKAIMRSLIVLAAQCTPFAGEMTIKLTERVSKAAKNPNKPFYNHYMFESLCVIIKKTGGSLGVGVFEQATFPQFQEILQNEVVDFMPYVFQIMALLLDMRPNGGGIPDAYNQLLPYLLKPDLWETGGNVPALVRLLKSYLRVDGDSIAAGHLQNILGVFQKLIASKNNDHYGFALLNAIIEYVSFKFIQPMITAILTLLFRRLQTSRTIKFSKCLIVLLCLLVIKQNAVYLANELEKIQKGMFATIIEKVFIRDLQKIGAPIDKKICIVAISNLLADCVDQLGNLWSSLLTALVALLELPEEDATDDDQFIDPEALPGYTSAYCQLAFAADTEQDPTGVANVKEHLTKSLKRISTSRPGSFQTLTAQLDPKVTEYLSGYSMIS